MLRAKYCHKGFFFPFNTYKVVKIHGQKPPLGIPLSVTIKKKRSELLGEPSPYFYSFILTSTGCKHWQQETPDCDTQSSVQETLRQ